MYTDPIADLLTRIRNAYLSLKLEVEVPYSRTKANVVRVLKKYGFIDDVTIEGKGKNRKIVIALKYDDQSQPVIKHLRRISKPSLRQYVKSKDIRPVQNGFGLSIISTNQGVMASHIAKKKGLGGEIIAEVW